MIEVNGERIDEYTLTPEALGVDLSDPATLAGGDAAYNAAITRSVLAGELGPARDLALVNAGATIYAAGNADSLIDGVELARQALDDGRGEQTLDAFIEATHAA